MKAPKNFYNTVDQRKLGLEDGLLPDVTAADNGKILKVTEGKWGPGDDENTIIEANPDEQPTVDLENLKIGDTVYSVKNPELTSIKSFKLTMSNGGQYNTNKPIIEFFNEAGQEASITSSDYTVECDKTYAGNAGMDQVCSISTPDTPGTFTYTFVNDFDIEEYNIMKLTRGGTFVNDIAKNIKIELSVDGENYITIYDETTITWSDAVPYHLISLKDGSEASTLLPIVTTADNGQVLGVVDGKWNKTDVPSNVKRYRVGWAASYIELMDNHTVKNIQDDLAAGYFVYLYVDGGSTNERMYYIVNGGVSGEPFMVMTYSKTGDLQLFSTNSFTGSRLNLVTT